jgi:DNA-binding NtrC family response regulator
MSKLEGKTVLIVDDETDLRDALEFEFEMMGLKVLKASGGNEAFELIKNGPQIDLILSDIRMSNGSGIDLLKEVRKLNPKIPIIAMITGFSNIPDNRIVEFGALKVFHKPVRVDEIFESFEKALEA